MTSIFFLIATCIDQYYGRSDDILLTSLVEFSIHDSGIYVIGYKFVSVFLRVSKSLNIVAPR